MKCKNCHINEAIKYSKYTTGEFCSRKCARGFSSKEKRIEINNKVSKKLKGTGNKPVKKICLECQNEFTVKWEKRNQKTCSIKCGRKLLCRNNEYIENLSKSLILAHQQGRMKGTRKSIRCYYSFKDSLIRCDSKVEYTCLDYFCKTYDVEEIKRCDFFIEYEFKSKIKRYLPDFVIKTKEDTYIVECKSFFKITDDVINSKSWSMYYDTIEPKKKVLKEFCQNNNYKDFFFTKKLHRYFYDNCDLRMEV